jgi:PAS domain S-box-containing protein
VGRIAARKRTSAELRLFRDLLDRSNDAIFAMDAKWGRFVDVNDRACVSLGYTRDELLGMTMKEVDVALEDDASWARQINELRKKGHLVLEVLHRRKDGGIFPVEVNIKLSSQAKGDYLIAVARDITERKQAEKERDELLNRQTAILEHVPAWVFLKDAGGRYIAVNQQFMDLLPRSVDNPIGKCDRDLFHKRIAEALEAEDDEVLRKGNKVSAERQVRLRDGRLVSMMISLSPVRDNRNNITGLVAVAVDITERKKAEDKQARLLKEVESANQELKDFAYVVSHDLKAPLRGIRTIVDWIVEDYVAKLDEDGKHQLNLLANRVDRMQGLIEGILEYSRVGRTREEKVEVDLGELVPEIVDTLVPPDHISITIENDLPAIECEETRIIQVFQNLLSNAIKYMDKPEGQISVACVDEDDFWKFSVADNGPGIEEQDYERVFQIFQTLAPRDEIESTGVGLTVVKKIVEMYEGRVWLESKVGEGSTFFFTLPKQMKESETKDEELQETNITC